MTGKFFLIFFSPVNYQINKVLYLPPQKSGESFFFLTFKINDGEVASRELGIRASRLHREGRLVKYLTKFNKINGEVAQLVRARDS
jgi:hypothetical protein